MAEADPDIVVMQEAIATWRPTATSLPGLTYVTDPDPLSSIVVASRYPIRYAPVKPALRAMPDGRTGGARAIRLEIDRPGATRPLILYAIHAPTTPPRRRLVRPQRLSQADRPPRAARA